jgi:hypothetical protein
MIERAFYSIREFCERNAISRAKFYRLKLPIVKLGRKTLVPVDTVLPTVALSYRKRCDSCGKFWADPPSALCVGCQAYEEHQR